MKERIGNKTGFNTSRKFQFDNDQAGLEEEEFRWGFGIQSIEQEVDQTILNVKVVRGVTGRMRLIYLGASSFFVQYRDNGQLNVLEIPY